MKQVISDILLFKTNIKSISGLNIIKSIFDKRETIHRWTIDTEDIDCVLRIVSHSLRPNDVINEITQLGYYCAELE